MSSEGKLLSLLPEELKSRVIAKIKKKKVFKFFLNNLARISNWVKNKPKVFRIFRSFKLSQNLFILMGWRISIQIPEVITLINFQSFHNKNRIKERDMATVTEIKKGQRTKI